MKRPHADPAVVAPRASQASGGTPVLLEAARAADRSTARHDLLLMSTGSHGCWAKCSCGWLSPLYVTTIGAHLRFGEHLTDVPRPLHDHACGDHSCDECWTIKESL